MVSLPCTLSDFLISWISRSTFYWGFSWFSGVCLDVSVARLRRSKLSACESWHYVNPVISTFLHNPCISSLFLDCNKTHVLGYIYIYIYKFIILHCTFLDIFQFWLSHPQGHTIPGIIHDIWVYIFIREWNLFMTPCRGHWCYHTGIWMQTKIL